MGTPIDMYRELTTPRDETTMHDVFPYETEFLEYTGLRDKNGVEIYEGDILKGFRKEQKDKDGVNGFEVKDTVTYWQGGAKVFGKNMQDGHTKENNVLDRFMWCNPGHFNTSESFYQIDNIEIIGNIYENPELIK